MVKSIKDIVPPKLVWEKRELIEMGKTLLKNEPSIMVEEYISGTDCTAVVLNENGNAKCIFTMPWNKAEEDELEGFEKILPNEDLTECPINLIKQVVEKLINHVNVLGVSRVDFIVKDFKIFILEINSLVFSGNLEGSQYTINNYRNGINLSKHIVSSAMKMFFKQKELSRMNETIEFIPQSNRLIGIENQVRMDKKYAIVSKDSIELVLLSDGQKAIYSPEMIESIYRYHGNFYLKLLFEQYLLDRQSNNLDEGDIRMVVLFMGVIIAQNADFYKNSLDGHLKELLDIALEFLNKNDKH